MNRGIDYNTRPTWGFLSYMQDMFTILRKGMLGMVFKAHVMAIFEVTKGETRMIELES